MSARPHWSGYRHDARDQRIRNLDNTRNSRRYMYRNQKDIYIFHHNILMGASSVAAPTAAASDGVPKTRNEFELWGGQVEEADWMKKSTR